MNIYSKDILRKQGLKIRDAETNKLEKSLIITAKLLPILEKFNTIGVYVSFSSEVSTDELIKALLNQHKVVVVPKLVNHSMIFTQIKSLDDLKTTNKFGIRESNSKEYLNKIDCMIIPGILFDLSKNRIGFGKGYYDRYLFNKDIYKIGICYDSQIVEHLDKSPNDISMDLVVTNKRLIH